MKKLATLLLAAGMLLVAAGGAKAIDFKSKGEWIFGFGAVESTFKASPGSQGKDVFQAIQRVRLQLEAVANEALSGVVYFEIGQQNWGRGNQGGALGADGTMVKIKRAYLDWVVPDTTLKLRMGIQGITFPNTAGGSAIMDDDSAGITANYKFNDNVSLTALWMRPLNDNYSPNASLGDKNPANYLDNLDIFLLALPVSLEGFKITPWAAYGAVGRNAFSHVDYNGDRGNGQSQSLAMGLTPRDYAMDPTAPGGTNRNWRRDNAYGDLFFVGLPMSLSYFDPLLIELDINYGYSGGFGKYDAYRRNPDGAVYHGRADSKREGWLAKALIEYKMDWGTPGILGWYASGDDDNIKNGSERMPSIASCGYFTSFMGDGVRGWSINGSYDKNLTFDGTWGLGLRLRDMSFVENLSHTFSAVYYGGTNSPSMIKYLGTNNNDSFSAATGGYSPYLTTSDYLVEFVLDSEYKVYDNLKAVVELGYIINGFDKDAWRKSAYQKNFTKADGYKAALIMQYTF